MIMESKYPIEHNTTLNFDSSPFQVHMLEENWIQVELYDYGIKASNRIQYNNIKILNSHYAIEMEGILFPKKKKSIENVYGIYKTVSSKKIRSWKGK